MEHGMKMLIILYLEQTNNQKTLSVDQFPFRQIHIIILPCSSHDKSVTRCVESSWEFPFSGSVWWGDHFHRSLRLASTQGFQKKLLLQEVPQISCLSRVSLSALLLFAVRFSNAHVSARLAERKACKDLTASLNWFCADAFLDPQGIISGQL